MQIQWLLELHLEGLLRNLNYRLVLYSQECQIPGHRGHRRNEDVVTANRVCNFVRCSGMFRFTSRRGAGKYRKATVHICSALKHKSLLF